MAILDHFDHNDMCKVCHINKNTHIEVWQTSSGAWLWRVVSDHTGIIYPDEIASDAETAARAAVNALAAYLSGLQIKLFKIVEEG